MKAQIRVWWIEVFGWMTCWFVIGTIGGMTENPSLILGSLLCPLMALRTMREISIARTVYKNERYRELARRDLHREFGR